ncbi:MAG: hypothetical protein RBR22_05450 [Desulfuromonas sp.]|nr:hypothetical protein [Desulfuromonas sp.]
MSQKNIAKISRRDLLFVGAFVVLMLFLYISAGKKLGMDVPANNVHAAFYQQLEQGGKRVEVEHGCLACHPIQSLPAAHPEKEECMVCHQPS